MNIEHTYHTSVEDEQNGDSLHFLLPIVHDDKRIHSHSDKEASQEYQSHRVIDNIVVGGKGLEHGRVKVASQHSVEIGVVPEKNHSVARERGRVRVGVVPE